MSFTRTAILAAFVCAPLACARGDRAEAPALAQTASDAPAAAASAASAESEAAPDAGVQARMVIRRATLQLRDDSPQDVIASATRLVEGMGGFVATSATSGVGSDVQQIDATLRFPADRFDAVLQALRAEGELLHESLSGQDVTEEYTDLTARLRAKRTLEDRLLTILSRVETVEDALRVETELSSVRTEIERMEGHKRVMEDRVSLATVDLTVSSPVRRSPQAAETVSSRIDRAFDDAGRGFVAVLTGLIRAMGVLLPVGLLLTPVGLGARAAWIRHRRRRMLPPGAR